MARTKDVETEPWQRGIPLPRLREFGALFKERHKHLVFGAFGLVKERDVADYLHRGRAEWVGEPPRAVALCAMPQRDSEQQDFCGRSLVIGGGTILIKAFAARTIKDGEDVLRKVVAQGAGEGGLLGGRPPVIWLELFEEDLVARDAAVRAGFHYVTTKISAGSEIKGVYVRGIDPPLRPLPAAERATLLALKPAFLSRDEHAAVRAEVGKFEDGFAQHYSDYNKRKSWTAFALRGYSDDPSFIIKPAEMSRSWKEANPVALSERPRWTSAARRFPATRKVVDRLGLDLDRVRFMRLRAKDGELGRHADITDREAGVADGRVARLHIPITTSAAVSFRAWTARGEVVERKFPERSLFYLDQRKPHAVTNTDPELARIHLVVDCLADVKLRALIERAAEAHSQVGRPA